MHRSRQNEDNLKGPQVLFNLKASLEEKMSHKRVEKIVVAWGRSGGG